MELLIWSQLTTLCAKTTKAMWKLPTASLIRGVSLSAGEGRILFLGFKDNNSHNEDVLVSINPDGSGRKVMPAEQGVIDTPVWDGGYLYLHRLDKDLAYPRPLYRVDAMLTGNSIFVELPGWFLTVFNGEAYCLSADGKSVLRLPSGEAAASFTSPIENVEYVNGMNILHTSDRSMYRWTVETGAVPIND